MPIYTRIDDMTWPCPGKDLDLLEYALRNCEPSKKDYVMAASVLAAFRELVTCSRSKREYVIRELRRSMDQLGSQHDV